MHNTFVVFFILFPFESFAQRNVRIPESEYRISKNEYIEKYAVDDTSRFLIELYFKKIRDANTAAIICLGANGVSLVNIDPNKSQKITVNIGTRLHRNATNAPFLFCGRGPHVANINIPNYTSHMFALYWVVAAFAQ